MRLIIVDDEPLARLRLRSLIEGLPEIDAQVVGEAGDTDQALALLQTVPADAVLLDIRLPGAGSNAGLRLAAALRRLPRPPAVIFVTAHAEHALAAFELQAIDYLTKPVRRERLRDALQRVPLPPGEGAMPPPEGPVLVVSERGRVLRLPLAEVLYCRAEQKYVVLRTPRHGHLLDESLAELELRLLELGGDYLRVHRNALVARHAIRALALRPREDDPDSDGWAVCVAPRDEWLAVSRRQVAAVRAALSAQAPPG